MPARARDITEVVAQSGARLRLYFLRDIPPGARWMATVALGNKRTMIGVAGARQLRAALDRFITEAGGGYVVNVHISERRVCPSCGERIPT